MGGCRIVAALRSRPDFVAGRGGIRLARARRAICTARPVPIAADAAQPGDRLIDGARRGGQKRGRRSPPRPAHVTRPAVARRDPAAEAWMRWRPLPLRRRGSAREGGRVQASASGPPRRTHSVTSRRRAGGRDPRDLLPSTARTASSNRPSRRAARSPARCAHQRAPGTVMREMGAGSPRCRRRHRTPAAPGPRIPGSARTEGKRTSTAGCLRDG